MSEADQQQAVEPQVYVKQEDGSLKPVELPGWLAERTEIYLALNARGLNHEAIEFIWANGQL